MHLEGLIHGLAVSRSKKILRVVEAGNLWLLKESVVRILKLAPRYLVVEGKKGSRACLSLNDNVTGLDGVEEQRTWAILWRLLSGG